MMIDMDHVSGLIRATVEAKILPRFRNLAAGEVAQKGPNDPVTIADIEAEEMLSRLLLEAYPETRVIGEELVSREPATLDALLGDTPVGTRVANENIVHRRTSRRVATPAASRVSLQTSARADFVDQWIR